MVKLKGIFNASDGAKRTQNQLFEDRILIGKVYTDGTPVPAVPLPDEDRKILSTTLRINVPRPTDVRHLPGVFLGINNPAGQAFVRLSLADIDQLIAFVDRIRPLLPGPLTSATHIFNDLQKLDRKTVKDFNQIQSRY